MQETETFYWKNETGEIKEHHISEFGTFLDKGEGHCVTGMEYRETIPSPTQYLDTHRPLAREVVDQGSTPEKEVVDKHTSNVHNVCNEIPTSIR